jgi:hypothetical protein
MESHFFEFEADFVDSLRCIPMLVRFKLDQCGIKLSLRAWSQFDLATRELLTYMPTDEASQVAEYRQVLSQAIEEIGEKVVPVAVDLQAPWMDPRSMPDAVTQKVWELAVDLDGFSQWKNLNVLQRFALTKLTRGGHENENFLPALREFGLTA